MVRRHCNSAPRRDYGYVCVEQPRIVLHLDSSPSLSWTVVDVNAESSSWFYTADRTRLKYENLLTPLLFEGPLANVLSIAALVSPWRMCLLDGVNAETCPWDGTSELLSDLDGHTFADPHWCYALNAFSLALGFTGNIFLLFNFTNRIRYIIALPFTIVLWYAATGVVRCCKPSLSKQSC